MPALVWQAQLERSLGIRVSMTFGPEEWQHTYTLRQELRFWIEVTKDLGISGPSGQTWTFHDLESLKASRGMAEDIMEFLVSADSFELCMFSRLPSMPRWTVQRLAFSFGDELDFIHKSPGHETATEFTCNSAPSQIRAGKTLVPCELSFRCQSFGQALLFQLYLTVSVEVTDFPTSTIDGVQNILVVHYFSSSPAHRVRAQRCVSSHEGMDGPVLVLEGSAKLSSNGSTIDFTGSRDGRWAEELFLHGHMQGLAVIEGLEIG